MPCSRLLVIRLVSYLIPFHVGWPLSCSSKKVAGGDSSDICSFPCCKRNVGSYTHSFPPIYLWLQLDLNNFVATGCHENGVWCDDQESAPAKSPDVHLAKKWKGFEVSPFRIILPTFRQLIKNNLWSFAEQNTSDVCNHSQGHESEMNEKTKRSGRSAFWESTKVWSIRTLHLHLSIVFLWGLCLCGKHNTSRSPYLLPYSKLSFLWNSLITYSSLQPKALWVGLPGAKKGHVHGRTEKMCPWSYQDIWRRVFVTIKILTETNKAAQSPSLFQDSWAFSRAFTIGIAASSITFWRAEHKAERQGQLD